MNHERDQSHAHVDIAPVRPDHDRAPGHASRSAQLDAPLHPIISGLIQRKARDANGVAEGADTAVAAASQSSGAALPDTIMRKFEGSIGADLSAVRIHTGAESAAAASAVGARAYTTGQDIHFGAGQYDPTSAGGQHLLAHEVAHTVQQAGGAAAGRQHKLDVSAPGDAHEHEADRAADAMIAGRQATISGTTGLARKVSRIATAYSDDHDLKELPPAPKFTAADGSFAAMAAAVQASLGGTASTVPAPTSGLAGAQHNLIECRDNAESSQVYYSTHTPSKWNPLAVGNFNATYAKNAQADAAWAITNLANVRIVGSATGSWIPLVNASNTSWEALVKQAKAMSIEVNNKVEKVPLAGLADGKDHYKTGDQQINAAEVGGAGMGMGTVARQLGIKAPDTSAYKQAMTAYTEARNELAPQERKIIMTLIPTSIASISEKLKKAEEEKDKWETVATAVDTFEKGLTVAFSAGSFAEGEVGQLGTTKKGLAEPEGINPKEAGEKATGMLSKVIEFRIAAIQKQIDGYNTNLKTYRDVAEAQLVRSYVDEYKNGVVKLRDKAKVVETEEMRMDAAFKEFGKTLDAELIKRGKAGKGSDENLQSAQLLSAVRSASVATQGAVDGLSSGGAADLPGLYAELKESASNRGTDQTAGGGRTDPRAAVFGIEAGRWSSANAAITAIAAALQRRQAQITGLENEFMSQFANSTHGTDSIK